MSPLLHPTLMDENVTVRKKSLARSLTYSPQREDVLENEQIIGALDGMEILDSKDAEAMECDA